ncbi:hypothetical protein [Streptomyces sp. NPDC088725]|uniref:hypothetical protein n=1 Tax=Streptomyces sp. NPDC088725 TaxID=3365873 RepID=UPI003828E590
MFSPRLTALLRDHVGQDVFRLEPDTVGIAGPDVTDRIPASRRATETARPTFKPLHGRSISRMEGESVMRTIGADVRGALARPLPEDVDLTGPWPEVPLLGLLGVDEVRLVRPV